MASRNSSSDGDVGVCAHACGSVNAVHTAAYKHICSCTNTLARMTRLGVFMTCVHSHISTNSHARICAQQTAHARTSTHARAPHTARTHKRISTRTRDSTYLRAEVGVREKGQLAECAAAEVVGALHQLQQQQARPRRLSANHVNNVHKHVSTRAPF